jgi:glycosyltransferase involved in cell wall biosynthesis
MLNFFAPINNTTGYGISSTNIWQQLRHTVNISLFPIGQIGIDNDDIKQSLQNDINNVFSSDIKSAPCLKIWHMHDLFTRIGNGKYFVFPFFEIDKFRPQEIAGLKTSDIIFATSEWAKKVFIQNGLNNDNIKLCPLGVDLNTFKIPENHIPKQDKYIFINIGKWEIRKSHDLLLQIFNSAFTPQDNVELWMINHNPFLNEEQLANWHRLYLTSPLGSKIKIFPRIGTQKELAAIINQADCGVYISRAEGWNNEILETMALDKPIIATNYSAHTEYCDKDNSYLVDIDELEPAYDGIWFDGFGKWAKLGIKQIEQTIEHMRFVYKNNIRTNLKGVQTAQKYTWQNSAKHILNNLS